MSVVFSLAKREFAAFFNSPVGYVVLCVYLGFAGFLFWDLSGIFVTKVATVRLFFAMAPWLFLYLCPAVTMRMLAEERKSGTIEVLLTLPATELQIVIGKFLGALATVVVAILFTLPYAFSVSAIAEPGTTFDYGPVIGAYVGMVLMASTFLSVGMFTSALTRNQIVSFILGVSICFLLIIFDSIAVLAPPAFAAVLTQLSVMSHFESIARGVIDTRDLFFYLSATVAGLGLTVAALRLVRR